MDYKKELEEALERARNLESPFYRQAAEIIFPQLKESDDEKTMRGLIMHLKECQNNCRSETMIEEYAKWIKLLEKRTNFMGALREANKKIGELVEENYYLKENKSTDSAYDEELSKLLEKVVCRFINNPDIPYSERDEVSKKIVPYVERLEQQNAQHSDIRFKCKFKPGDFIIQQITNGTFTGQIVSIDTAYRVDGLDGSLYTIDFYEEPTMRLWTLEDANQGDVLIYPDGTFTIFDRIETEGLYWAFVVQESSSIRFNSTCSALNAYPATKGEREQLMIKMQNSGYKWDAETLRAISL